jgi:thioredoxin 1
MTMWIRKNIDKVAVAGAIVAIAAISIGAGSNTGPAAKPPASQSHENSQRTGDRAMSTVTKQEGRVYHADEANFAEVVLQSEVPVLVDFYADWCGPCRALAPVLDELAQETSEAKIVKVNVDQSPQLAARYGIASIPNLKVFQDGKVVEEQAGLAGKARLKAMLDI